MMKYARFRIACLLAAVAGLGLFASHADAQVYNRFGPSNGIMKGDVNTYQTTAATGADVTALFSGTCTGAQFLRGDASCFNLLGSANSWTASQSYTLARTNASAPVFLQSTTTALRFDETDAAVANRQWEFAVNTEQLRLGLLDDAGVLGNTALLIDRTGTTVDTVNIVNGTLQNGGNLVPNVTSNPTWTGAHTFTGSAPLFSASAPRIRFSATGAGVDEKQWAAQVFSTGTFSLNTRTDADGTGADAIVISRTGTAINTTAFNAATFQVNASTATNFSNSSSTNTFAGPVRATSTTMPAIATSTTAVSSEVSTTDVIASLQVTGGDAPTSAFSMTRASASNASPTLFSNKSRGSVGAFGAVLADDNLYRFLASGHDGTNWVNAGEITVAVDGTPGANDMPGRLVFSTTADGANSPTERFRIASNGAWGLAGNNFGTGGQVLTSNGSGAAPTWQSIPGGGDALLAGTQTFTGVNTFSNDVFVTGNTSNLLAGSSSIQSVGTLGSAPAIQATSDATRNLPGISGARYTNDASPFYLVLGKSRGTTIGTNTIVQAGDEIARLEYAGADGTDLVTPAADIRVEVDGTPGANDMPGRIVFRTTADGAATTTEQMRINNGGALGFAGANFGTSGQVLTSNGTGSPPSWQAAPGASASGASATAGGSTSLASGGTESAIALSTEQFDTGNFHDNVTNNSRVILPSSTGYASCSATISGITGNTTASTIHDVRLYLRKNGTDYLAATREHFFEDASGGGSYTFQLSVSNAMIPANGTDYVEMTAIAVGFSTNSSVVANSLTSTAATTRLTCSAQ